MYQKFYLLLSGAIFFLVAMLHLVRILFDFSIIVAGWIVPLWISYIGFPVALGYTIWAFLIFKKRPG